VTVIEAIAIVRRVYNLPLAEAKRVVLGCGAWHDVAEGVKRFHDELERLIKEDEQSDQP
jgi:hypothetical protein